MVATALRSHTLETHAEERSGVVHRRARRIALDVQFSQADVQILEARGFEIVQASHGETDREWLQRAADHRVELIASPDSDCEIWAYDHEIPFAKLPGNRKID